MSVLHLMRAVANGDVDIESAERAFIEAERRTIVDRRGHLIAAFAVGLCVGSTAVAFLAAYGLLRVHP